MIKEIKNRLTKNAQNVLERAQQDSQQEDLSKINALLMLKPIHEQKGSLGNILMKTLISNPDKIIYEKNLPNIKLSIAEVLVKSFQLASSTNSPFVGTEHLLQSLLLLLSEKDKKIFDIYFKKNASDNAYSKKQNSDKPVNRIPTPNNDFFQDINSIMESFLAPQGKKNNKRQSFLNDFAVNLNEEIKKHDFVLVGRNDELERISNVLGRKSKNNPVLIGEPGVGKTAIIEGLAQKIHENKAPFYLANKKIFSLDLGLLVAGTNFRGEFEARLKEVINEAKENEEVILFIDEIHNLVGAGNAVGGMDAANILKPALSRGEIQVIGATTIDEYHKHIEKDAALERRFQPILIEEPSQKEAVSILKGIKKSYERYHNVRISEDALLTATSLAKKLFPDRFLPDNAIDLLDETASRIKSQNTDSKIYGELSRKKQKLNNIIDEKEHLVITDRYEEAIHLRNLEKTLEKEIKRLKDELRKNESDHPIQLEAIDIKETAARSARIPVSLLSQETKDIPDKTKKLLEDKLVGQDKAISKIHRTLLRQFAGIGHPDRPLGSFLFIGSSGIGKTMTAKTLAQAISPTGKQNLIQINMSEFMEKHSISKLLGAPAGYVGYDEASGFADKIRRNPYSVVLFDEIEKADPAILNILLQILEEGRITDAKGRNIDFKNCIIILTSNIGTRELNQVSELGFGTTSKKQKIEKERKEAIEEIKNQIEEVLPLELINRLDHIIIFDFLKKKDLEKIAKKELQKLSLRLKKRNVQMTIAPQVITFIAEKSYDPKEGARLVRRKIEEFIEPIIAENLLKSNKKNIRLSVSKNKIVFG